MKTLIFICAMLFSSIALGQEYTDICDKSKLVNQAVHFCFVANVQGAGCLIPEGHGKPAEFMLFEEIGDIKARVRGYNDSRITYTCHMKMRNDWFLITVYGLYK